MRDRLAENRATRSTRMASTFPSLDLASPVAWRPWGRPSGRLGITAVGLAGETAKLAIGPVDFDHRHLVGQQVPGQPCPVTAGALDADELEGPEGLQPTQQPPVAGHRRGETLDAEQGPSFVEGGRHVDVEVRVDPSGDAPRDSGHRHLFLSLGVGDTAAPERWTRQRWALLGASSYEVTPSDRRCRVRVRAGPTYRLQDSPRGRQPVLMESDLARARTYTLTSSPSGVVDRQRATTILAAGSVTPNLAMSSPIPLPA